MSLDVSTIGIAVELKNGQTVLRQLDAIESAGTKVEGMGKRVAASTSTLDSAIKRNTVSIEQGRRAWAAAGGDMHRFGQELSRMVNDPMAKAAQQFAEVERATGGSARGLGRLENALMGVATQAAADAEKALAEARERATQRTEDLTARWFRLSGQLAAADDAALFAQQRRERNDYISDKASPRDLAMLDVIQGMERAQAVAQRAIDEQIRQGEEQARLLQDQLSVAERSFEETRRVADSLAEYGRSLQLSDASPLSPIQRLDYARSERDRLYSAALGGDTASAGRFQAAADAYLREQRSYSASGVDTARGFADTVAMVETLASMYGRQATVEEQIVEGLKQQLATLQAQLDELRSGNAIAEATKAEWIRAIETQRDTVTGPAADLLAALESVRGSVDASSQSIVDAQAQSLAANRDALNLATQQQINAIQNGADLQTLAQYEQIRALNEQRLTYDNNAVREIVELGRIAGFGSDQVQELIRAREAYDNGIQAQIDALGGLGQSIGDAWTPPGGFLPIGPPELPEGAATESGQQAIADAITGLSAALEDYSARSDALTQEGFNQTIAGQQTIVNAVEDILAAVRRGTEAQNPL
jgi:hypothetical protein